MTDDCPAAAPEPASSPLSLTLSQWWCVLKGVAATAERANLALISAGVAFFGLMGALLFGVVALAGLISIGMEIFDPSSVGMWLWEGPNNHTRITIGGLSDKTGAVDIAGAWIYLVLIPMIKKQDDWFRKDGDLWHVAGGERYLCRAGEPPRDDPIC